MDFSARERAACSAMGAVVNANSSLTGYDNAYFYGAHVDDYNVAEKAARKKVTAERRGLHAVL